MGLLKEEEQDTFYLRSVVIQSVLCGTRMSRFAITCSITFLYLVIFFSKFDVKDHGSTEPWSAGFVCITFLLTVELVLDVYLRFSEQ